MDAAAPPGALGAPRCVCGAVWRAGRLLGRVWNQAAPTCAGYRRLGSLAEWPPPLLSLRVFFALTEWRLLVQNSSQWASFLAQSAREWSAGRGRCVDFSLSILHLSNHQRSVRTGGFCHHWSVAYLIFLTMANLRPGAARWHRCASPLFSFLGDWEPMAMLDRASSTRVS